MKKLCSQLMSLFLALALIVSFVPSAKAATIASGYVNSLNWALTDDGKLTFTGSGTMPNYQTNLGNNPPWYEYRLQIKPIHMSDGITSVGNFNFVTSTNLESVYLPSNLTHIGEMSFFGCSKLKIEKLPASVKTIGSEAFSNCTALNLKELPPAITSIGASAFSACSNLAITSIPNTIKVINNFTFSGCSKLALTELPSGLTSIGDYAFNYCSSLRLSQLPNAAVSVGISAFTGVYWPYHIERYLQNHTGSIEYTFKDDTVYYAYANATVTINGAAITGYSVNTTKSTATIKMPQYILHGGIYKANVYYDFTTWQVTFDSNEGSYVPPQSSIQWGTTISKPIDPIKAGYIFAGWYNGSTLFNFSTPITQNITLKAKWTPRSDMPYRVKHYQQDVTGSGYTLRDTDDLIGTTDATVSASAKSYSGFHELSTHPDRTATGSIAPEGSLVLKLYYNRNLHSVSFNTAGGTSVAAQSEIRFEGVATEPAAPSKVGYNFGGWWADPVCTIAYDFSAPITSDVIVYASWVPRGDTTYRIEHYQQNVSGVGYTLTDTDDLTGTTASTVTAAPNIYLGFSQNLSHPNRVSSGVVAPDGSLVLRLYYVRNLHSITFDTRGGSSVATQTDIRFEGTATEPLAPVKQGYDFEGWWADEDCTVSFDFNAPITADLTVYASWAARSDTAYKVEHYQQDVSGSGYTLIETDYLNGTTEVLVTATSKAFTGFYEFIAHPNRKPNGSIAPDGSLVLKLYYVRNLLSITFESRGGSNVATQTDVRFEGTATEPTPPIKQGYDFGGWWANEDCTVTFDFVAPITADVTVYASWIAHSNTAYRVEHYKQDVIGSSYFLEDADELTGTTDTYVNAMARTYTGFNEHTAHPDNVPFGIIAPDGSLVLKLYYDRTLHNMTFSTVGGTSVAAHTGIRFEGTATEPQPPTKQGHEFGGWYADEGCTIMFDFTAPITADITVYASWVPRTFRATLNPNGGEVSPSSILLVYGQPYGDLPAASRAGHSFTGWYSQADGGAKITTGDLINRVDDVTLYAQWANNQTGIVDGEVNNQDGDPLVNIKVTLRAGAVNYKSTMTDTQGRFTFTNVRYGTYNLVAEQAEKVVTTLFEMRAQQVEQSITLPVGLTNSIIVVEENAPQIVAGGLDSLFGHGEVYASSDAAVVDGGGKVELRLTIVEKTPESAGDEGRELAQGTAKPINMLLEMTIIKRVYAFGASDPTNVETLAELPELMTIIIPLAEEQKGKTGYTVFRSHGGSVDEIRQQPNADGEYILVENDRIILYTQKFSLYALAHEVPQNNSQSHVIMATASPGGSISPSGKVSIINGDSKHFTITPEEGHKILDVLVDGKSVGAVTSYKFDQVYAYHTIEVVFYCPSIQYNDLDIEKWYHEPVDYVINHGYMSGIGRGQWAPEQSIIRAEFVTVLARLHGDRLPDIAPFYEDVKALAWYAPSIAWAQESGVGIGYGKRRFGPNDVLTREQMVLMLYRYAGSGNPGSNGILTAYQDSGRISLWSTDAVVWAVNEELLHGDGKGYLKPSGEITRAEVAAILMRYLEKN